MELIAAVDDVQSRAGQFTETITRIIGIFVRALPNQELVREYLPRLNQALMRILTQVERLAREIQVILFLLFLRKQLEWLNNLP